MTAVPTPSTSAAGVHKAWFRKDAEGFGRSKLREFELTGTSLLYRDEHGVPHGDIQLAADTHVVCEGKLLRIETPTRTWKLHTERVADASAWATLLEAARDSLRPRAATTATSSTLPPGPASVAALPTAPVAASPGARPTPVAPGAWFTKKAQTFGKERARFFEFYGGELHYFAKEEHGRGVEELGTIDITPATAIAADQANLVITTPDRVWTLIAESAAQTTAWMTMLWASAPNVRKRDSTLASPASAPPATSTAATVAGAHLPPTSAPQSSPAGLSPASLAPPTTARAEPPRHKSVTLQDKPAGESSTDADVAKPPVAEALLARLEQLLVTGMTKYAHLELSITAEFGDAAFEECNDAVVARIKEFELSSRKGFRPAPKDMRTAWFVKKAERVGRSRRRFFELHGCQLRYFEAEDDGRGVVHCGEAELTRESQITADGVQLTIANTDRQWTLLADSPAIADEWCRLLQARKPLPLPAPSTASVSAPAAPSPVATPDPGSPAAPATSSAAVGVKAAPATAWFVKKAEGRGRDQRRFFELHGTELRYFESESGGRGSGQKGSVDILPASEVLTSGRDLFIGNPDRTWQLTADTEALAIVWHDRLETARLTLPGAKPATVTATRAVVDEPEEDDDDVRLQQRLDELLASGQHSYAAVKADLVARFGASMFSARRGSVVAALRTVEQSQAALADADTVSVRGDADVQYAGWFVKKAEKRGRDRRRFFELHAAELRYYESEHAGHGVGIKGTVPVTAETEVKLRGGALTLTNADRVWNLVGEEEGAARTLADTLLQLIEEGSGLQSAAGEVDLFPRGRGVWLDKKRHVRLKHYYFTVTYARQGHTLNLVFYAALHGDAPSDRKGAIPLGPSLKVSANDREILLVR